LERLDLQTGGGQRLQTGRFGFETSRRGYQPAETIRSANHSGVREEGERRVLVAVREAGFHPNGRCRSGNIGTTMSRVHGARMFRHWLQAVLHGSGTDPCGSAPSSRCVSHLQPWPYAVLLDALVGLKSARGEVGQANPDDFQCIRDCQDGMGSDKEGRALVRSDSNSQRLFKLILVSLEFVPPFGQVHRGESCGLL